MQADVKYFFDTEDYEHRKGEPQELTSEAYAYVRKHHKTGELQPGERHLGVMWQFKDRNEFPHLYTWVRKTVPDIADYNKVYIMVGD